MKKIEKFVVSVGYRKFEFEVGEGFFQEAGANALQFANIAAQTLADDSYNNEVSVEIVMEHESDDEV